MALTEEFIKEHKLEEGTVTALNTLSSESEAEIKKSYDGLASKNADKILHGAFNLAGKVHNVTINQGEKVADFATRLAESAVTKERETVKALKTDYEKKLEEVKGGKGNEVLQLELNTAKENLQKAIDSMDGLKKKEAEFDKLTEAGFEGKYNDLVKDHGKQIVANAFNEVKPAFPKEVNEFEAQAKWDKFVNGVQDTHDIKFVDGEYLAVNKENEHKSYAIKDLLGKDSDISALLDTQPGSTGTGTAPIKKGKVTGVPFDVPESANGIDGDSALRGATITEYLKEQKIDQFSDEYAAKYSEYNKFIMTGGKKEEPQAA